jgi:hypothetical protein
MLRQAKNAAVGMITPGLNIKPKHAQSNSEPAAVRYEMAKTVMTQAAAQKSTTSRLMDFRDRSEAIGWKRSFMRGSDTLHGLGGEIMAYCYYGDR